MGNFILIIMKGIGIFVGTLLVFLGGWMSLENWQAPGTINLLIMVVSGIAIAVGSLILWLALRTYKKP